MEVFLLQIVILSYSMITYCEGLGSPAISVENLFGVLSLFQPTFVGRNVTFKFTPSTKTAIDDVKWKYVKRNSSEVTRFSDDNENVLLHDDGKSSVLVLPDVDWSFNGTTVYTSIGNKEQSNYTDATSCGELYLLSDGPFITGDNVSFAYFPSPVVAKENVFKKYLLKLIKGNTKDQTPVPLRNGVLEVYQQNYEHVFTLFNVTKTNSGQYWIQCSNGLSGPTNGIHLSVKGHLIIGPLITISTCRHCIVFSTEETLEKVTCETDVEYSATNVKFEIGSKHYASNKTTWNRFGLDSYERPANTSHLMNVICTVFVKHRNMSVKASIYIVVNPKGPPHLSANEVLLEGETVDITCISSSARPPPLLRLFVEATEIGSDTNVSTTFDNSTRLYKSVSKLHSFKKEWGNKLFLCLQSPEVNGLYNDNVSKPVYIHYKYPPSRLIIAVIDQGNLSTTAVRCSALDSNPVCNIKWESSIEYFRYTILPQPKISTIWLNVTEVDFGKQIRCSAECPDFSNALSNSTTLIFAKKPKVEIRPSSVLPVPPNTHLAFTCFANAYPNGNITWTTLIASNAPTSHGQFCVHASACTYNVTTSDVEQEYKCIAKNAHGSDSLSISVTVQERKNHDDSGFLDVAVGISSGIAFLLIVTVVMCLCRYHIQAKNRKDDNHTEMAELQPPTVAESDAVTHTLFDGAEYAVIHKKQRDPENVALPSNQYMGPYDTKNKCLENAVTGSSVHVEQPIVPLEAGPSKQFDVSGCQSKEDIKRTDNENDNAVSKQKNIDSLDTTNAKIPKLHL